MQTLGYGSMPVTIWARFNVNKHAAYKALKTAVTNLFGEQFSYQTIDEKQENLKKQFLDGFKIFTYIDDADLRELLYNGVPLITRLEKNNLELSD
jgi:plasmid replication initiation protein